MNQLPLQMCQDLGLLNTFQGIMDQVLIVSTKPDVIRYALSINDLPKEETVIIGDTKFDLIGGQTVDIKTMAVTWGFEILKNHFDFTRLYLVTLHLISL